MKCPYCMFPETKVVDSRQEDEVIRRRRECEKCGKRFTTFERPELLEFYVIKKDGRRERFDRNKLRIGIIKACEKRQISQDKIESIIDSIESFLRKKKDIEVTSQEVGNCVMKKLKVLDPVAYIRFASVYQEFDDIDAFEEALDTLKKKKGG
ncbi:transcriptional regulator NrdR [Candidatus Micrarchaeota archaeon]|jgi:transcriptional repressor NrdR|nr:transcriptional regulator NrdR [Candidatus Micrarchaeota archaeon]